MSDDLVKKYKFNELFNRGHSLFPKLNQEEYYNKEWVEAEEYDKAVKKTAEKTLGLSFSRLYGTDICTDCFDIVIKENKKLEKEWLGEKK